MKLKIALSGLLIVAMAYTMAAASSDTDVLLDLLVKKGVLTEQDATNAKAELEAKKKEEVQKEQYAKSTTTKHWLGSIAPGVNLDGLLQLEYLHYKDGTNTFANRRIRLDVNGQPDDHWEWKIYSEFAGNGNNFISGASLSTTGSLSASTTKKQYVYLLDAYIRYKFNQLANIQAGQFKVPFSQESLQDDKTLEFIDRSQIGNNLVPDRDNGSIGRDIGVQFDGSYAESSGGRPWVQYAVAVVNGNGIDVSDNNKEKDFAGRVVFYPIRDLSVGVSGYKGEQGTTPTAHNRIGGELAYVRDPFFVKAEYIAGTDNTTDKDGWYIGAGYKIIPKLQLVARYDTYDSNANKQGYNSDQETVGLNWFITPNNKLQFNYIHQDLQSNAGTANDVAEVQYQLSF